MRKTLMLAPPLLLGWLLFTQGCEGGQKVGSHGTTVGGRCTTDNDCEKRCLTGGDFPGGFCSLTCTSDADCPSGTLCIDRKEGVCMLPCETADQCQDLGPGYVCNDLERKGMRDVKANVCIARN